MKAIIAIIFLLIMAGCAPTTDSPVDKEVMRIEEARQSLISHDAEKEKHWYFLLDESRQAKKICDQLHNGFRGWTNTVKGNVISINTFSCEDGSTIIGLHMNQADRSKFVLLIKPVSEIE